MGLFGFVAEIVDVLAIFPQGHTLIVISATVPVAYPMRVANEERSDLVFHTEVDHGPGGFMARVTDTPFASSAHPVLGALQRLPPAGVLLAPALLFGKLSQLAAMLPFEGTDAPSGHDQGCTGVRGHCRKMNFSQVNRCSLFTRSVFRLRNFDTDVQLKASIPDQGAGSAVGRKVKRQHKRLPALAHRQDNPAWFLAHRLGGPMDGVEAFRPPGVLHPHLWVFFAECAGGLDDTEEGAEDGLDRLAMQGEAPLGAVV
jgi:hypothetical protein